MKSINQDNFKDVVINSESPVLVDVYAPWCEPCKRVTPMLEELEQAYDTRVVFCKLDGSTEKGVVAKYNVKTVPTLLLFVDGVEVSRTSKGSSTREELVSFIEDSIE